MFDHFRQGVTEASPGSYEGLQLTVYDIDEARADLLGRGVAVSETFHDVTGIFHHAGTKGACRGAAGSTPTTALHGVQRSGRQRLAAPGDKDPASGR